MSEYDFPELRRRFGNIEAAAALDAAQEMTPVERIEAALEKLEALKAERGYIEDSGWLVEENPNDRPSWEAPPEPFIPITNDEIMVVLHRTIDAQLAMLTEGLRRYEAAVKAVHGPWAEDLTFEHLIEPIDRRVLALADAILGADS